MDSHRDSRDLLPRKPKERPKPRRQKKELRWRKKNNKFRRILNYNKTMIYDCSPTPPLALAQTWIVLIWFCFSVMSCLNVFF